MIFPGIPHHVVQRGNRRQAIFYGDPDRRAYLDLLGAACARHGTRCLAWCLMDNHIHLILVPEGRDGLRAPLSSAHTAYSQRINRAHGLSGHLFQGRFASYAMDDAHLMVAARYIENNPVKAGLVARAGEWPWSSARAHIRRRPDGLTDIAALGMHVPDWQALLERGLEAADETERIEAAMRSGRPVGGRPWLTRLGAIGRTAIDGPPRRGRPRGSGGSPPEK